VQSRHKLRKAKAVWSKSIRGAGADPEGSVTGDDSCLHEKSRRREGGVQGGVSPSPIGVMSGGGTAQKISGNFHLKWCIL